MSDDGTTLESGVKIGQGQLVMTHVRENSVAYMIGALILQQLGWLNEALGMAQGVCL